MASHPIELNEVGSYGELNSRPNPNGYVVLQVPPFEEMLPFLAKQLGRDLTAAEIEVRRQNAPSIVVPKEVADKMPQARAARS